MDSTERHLNFLIATWEGGGSVGPKLTLARKLMDAGHRVRVMSDECNRPETVATGASFVAWTRAPSRKDRNRESELIRDWAQANPLEGFRQAVESVFAGPALAYAQDVIEELQREPADLVVSSDLLFGVLTGCEVIGQRVVVMPCNSLFFPLPGAPLAGPGKDTEEVREFMTAMAEGMRDVLASGLPALNTARAVLGLDPVAELLDQFAVAEKILIGISRTFDFGPETDPPGYAYVGPQIDDPLWVDGWNSPWLPDDTRPLVLVAFSTTFQNHAALLQRTVDALGKLPVRALVTLGPTIPANEIRAPANIELVASAPHNIVMKEADIVVTHGGHGTVARAMLARLPMLVIPQGRDQDGNGARIAAHGAGLSIPPTSSCEAIAAAVQRLLFEPSFSEAAARLGSKVEQETRESPIVQELEKLCCPVYA